MTSNGKIFWTVLESRTEDTPAKKFVKDMYDRHYNNPINDREFVVPYKDDWSHHAMFEISAGHHPTEAHIHYFRTHPRKSGVGSKALKDLQGHAKRHGVSLHLGVGGHETPHRVLTKFYKKHGFKGDKNDMKWHPEKDIKEDAPTVNVGGGAIAGAGIGPQGEPGRSAKLGLMRRKLDVLNRVKKAKSDKV